MAVLLLLYSVGVIFCICPVNGAVLLRSGENTGLINGSSPGKTGSSPILSSANSNFTLQWSAVTGDKFNLAVVYLAGTVGSPRVWMANRDQPVSAAATLVVEANGNLLIRESDGKTVWSMNAVGDDAAWAIDLLDTGNLVVTNSTGGQIWQSFDYPTDTLLPGQKLRTGQRVIAGTSLMDTRAGIYSVEIMKGGLIMYAVFDNQSWPYHVVGFNGTNTVESVSNPNCEGITVMTYSEGGGECIFQQLEEGATSNPACNQSFSVQVGTNDNSLNANLKFFRLDSDGNFRTYLFRVQYGWGLDQELLSGSTACSLPNPCGSFGVCTGLALCSCLDNQFFQSNPNPQLGCTRIISQPSCKNPDHTQLIAHTGVNYFANDFLNQSLITTIESCQKSCLDSCNCTAAFYDEKTSLCFHYSSVMSLRKVDDSRYTAFIKVDNTTLANLGTTSSSSLSAQVLAGIIVGVILFIVGLIILFFIASKLRRKMSEMNDKDAFLDTLPGLPYRFTFKELKKATDGFKHRLGGGGFGSVYEGKLEDGSKVAVKRLESARQGHKEFHAEVAALGSMSHLNLVRLRGFCVRGVDRLLVYEYMSNRSLDKWLFQKSGEGIARDQKVLDWETRYKIAVATARGLAFLHEESRECVVHLDVKPQNILLDDDFNAKLSDFGLSRLIDRLQTDIVTNMKGTPGYLAPEWLLGAAITSKSDVYSFGMVLLELVSGRRNLDLSRGNLSYFPAWAVVQIESNRSMEDIVDKRLAINSSDAQSWPPSLARTIKVAFWCIQEDPSVRPAMTKVLHMLEGLCEVEEPPSLLQFAYRTMNNKNVVPSQLQSNSTIDLTNWMLSAPR